ncbi:hypothetical protein [Clostridium ganghwense]|uniref:HEAT repeat domain-containing protein n=1 Tax=Clostridium ganghwense TaxID=312089 RepID=A0ABT4CRI9_9CLOT|nr:hypothetical protein [Clostridium ganghwense]MCY6371685.1 hypothetical protein [Clostridium ganghwense]
MMNQRQESTKEIIDRLSQSGLSFEALNVLEKYFIGDVEEKKLSGVLMNEDVDFNGVYSDWHEIFYNYIRSDEELIDKFIKVLFLIFKEKAFDIYVMSYIIGEDITEIYTKFKKLNIPFYYYIVNKAQEIEKENPYYYHARFFIKYFRNLKNMYKKYKEDYIKAFNYADGNVKLYLAIEILRKDCNEVENLEEYINEALKKFVFEFFNYDYNNEEKINNYLNGEEECLEEVVNILRNLPNASANNFDSLKKINMVVYNCWKISELGRRILKLVAYLDVKNTVDNIFDFSCAVENDYRRYRKKIQGQLEEFPNELKKLGLPNSFYLVWVADQYFNDDIYESDREYLKKVINEYLNHDIEGFKEAAKLSDGIAKEYLEHYLWKLKNDDELIEEAKDKCINNVKEVLIECDFEKKEIDDFILYMEGEKEIEKVLKPSKFKNNDNIYGYHIRNYLKRIVWYSDVNEIFNKVVRYFIQLQNGKLFDYLIDEFINENDSNFNRFMSIVDSLQVGIKEVLPLLSYNEFEGHHSQECYELSSKWIKNKPYEVSKYIHLCRAEGRADLIKRIYESNFVKEDREEFKKILLKFTADSSKTVRECVMNIINEALSNDECKKIFIPLLSNKKAAVREGAVKVLVPILDEECIVVLKDQLEKETSSKVKNIIIQSLNIETENNEQESMSDINEYCKKNLNKRKKAKIEWLHPNTLPALILKESGQEVSEDTLHYMLISFADNKEVEINSEVKNMMSFFTQCSLADIALESLERWCAVGAEAKKKWILSLVGMFGDTKCVQFLEKHIKEWPKKSRGAIACEALKALAMIGSDETLMIIDSIARKFKFKQVKKAASEALDFAAKELGIDKEELSDRVV